MKLGKRRKDDDPVAEPDAGADPVVPRDGVTETWTAPANAPSTLGEGVVIEPAVDSEAVELVGDVAPAPPVAVSMPDPVTPVTPLPRTPPAAAMASETRLPPAPVDAPAFATSGADPLKDELRVLATERPEIVVGAAFAGGIVAAMILRRLGN